MNVDILSHIKKYSTVIKSSVKPIGYQVPLSVELCFWKRRIDFIFRYQMDINVIIHYLAHRVKLFLKCNVKIIKY